MTPSDFAAGSAAVAVLEAVSEAVDVVEEDWELEEQPVRAMPAQRSRAVKAVFFIIFSSRRLRSSKARKGGHAPLVYLVFEQLAKIVRARELFFEICRSSFCDENAVFSHFKDIHFFQRKLPASVSNSFSARFLFRSPSLSRLSPGPVFILRHQKMAPLSEQ